MKKKLYRYLGYSAGLYLLSCLGFGGLMVGIAEKAPFLVVGSALSTILTFVLSCAYALEYGETKKRLPPPIPKQHQLAK